jgi:uncharacterized OsmC-like protein
MVSIKINYEGGLHCLATHGPSGTELPTDAPRDNMGQGAAFSPTDLVAAGFGTCILTTMGIVAQRLDLDIRGGTVYVEKHMSDDRPRRIVRLAARVRMPLPPDHGHRGALEAAAHGCPVHHSLHPDVVKDVTLEWTG